MADSGAAKMPMGRPRNKLLVAISDSDRRRLSATEAGQYVRVIIQRLPKHLKDLQKEMLDNKEVQQQMTLEDLQSKLGKLFSKDSLEGKDGLDWKRLEDPKNLDRIDEIIRENNTTLSFHKHMLPVQAIRASFSGKPGGK